MDRKETMATEETLTGRSESRDFGFVGYRDYKESEFYKRYVSARAKMPQDALEEIKGKPEEKKEVGKKGVGCGIVVAIFGVLFLALCLLGRFVKVDDTIVASILGCFDGSDLITAVMDVVAGDISNILDLAGIATLAVAAVLVFAAVIGGIVVAARGKGVGKLMKTCSVIMFFLTTASFVICLARRLDLTIGLSALIIFGGAIALSVLVAPGRIKEKK